MVGSLIYSLWASQGVFFTSDELFWLGASPDLGLREAFEPHSGHLIAVPRLLYRGILEAFGGGYLPFRLLSLGAVFLAVGLLFELSRRRVGDFVALAPCVVLVFFGSDSSHLLQGNGFTVMFATACGLLALLAIEKPSRRRDILACLALSLGVVTYTTALPFVAGIAVAVLCRPDRWARIWIAALPVVIFLGWRVWLKTAGIEYSGGDADLANILLLPSWAFQSFSAILDSISGLSYNFSGVDSGVPDGIAGPALAIAFVVAVGWRVAKDGLSTALAVALAIALALFTIQALTWLPPLRVPGADRYLFPGAVVTVLIAVEAARGLSIGRTGFIAVWLVALAGLGSNLALIKDRGDDLGVVGEENRARVTAFMLSRQAADRGMGPERQSTLAPWFAGLGAAVERYGIGQSPEDLAEAPPEARTVVDTSLAAEIGAELVPASRTAGSPGCDRLGSDAGFVRTEVPAGGGDLFSGSGGAVTLRRFGVDFSVDLGSLEPGEWTRLILPRDGFPQPWKISVRAPQVVICPIPE